MLRSFLLREKFCVKLFYYITYMYICVNNSIDYYLCLYHDKNKEDTIVDAPEIRN